MKRSTMKRRLLKHLRLRESWVIFFILGIIMMDYPFIHIFNKPEQVLGVPLLLLYLQGGWLVSIAVIYLFTRAIPPDDATDKDDKP